MWLLPKGTWHSRITSAAWQFRSKQRAVLGGKPGAQDQRAVLLEVVVHILELMRLTRLRGRDPSERTQRTLKLRRDKTCPVCGEAPSITTYVDYEGFCNVR